MQKQIQTPEEKEEVEIELPNKALKVQVCDASKAI
jgi:hypothetical protein